MPVMQNGGDQRFTGSPSGLMQPWDPQTNGAELRASKKLKHLLRLLDTRAKNRKPVCETSLSVGVETALQPSGPVVTKRTLQASVTKCALLSKSRGGARQKRRYPETVPTPLLSFAAAFLSDTVSAWELLLSASAMSLGRFRLQVGPANDRLARGSQHPAAENHGGSHDTGN